MTDDNKLLEWLFLDCKRVRNSEHFEMVNCKHTDNTAFFGLTLFILSLVMIIAFANFTNERVYFEKEDEDEDEETYNQYVEMPQEYTV